MFSYFSTFILSVSSVSSVFPEAFDRCGIQKCCEDRKVGGGSFTTGYIWSVYGVHCVAVKAKVEGRA